MQDQVIRMKFAACGRATSDYCLARGENLVLVRTSGELLEKSYKSGRCNDEWKNRRLDAEMTPRKLYPLHRQPLSVRRRGRYV